jgi:hypothetical protein
MTKEKGMTNVRRLMLAVLVAATVLAIAVPALAELPTLIPREVLLGNPTKASPRISPDGTKLSYIAPSKEGVLNVWVKTVGKDDDQMVTKDTHRGIRMHSWAEDGTHMLYPGCEQR